MWAIQFFVYALMVTVLLILFGGTMIGYYFTRKQEYEANKAKKISEALVEISKKNGQNISQN